MREGTGRAQVSVEMASPEPLQEQLQRWMAQIADGDSAAFEALFRAMYERMCFVARAYVKSAADAEDVVEDTFLKLWTNRDRIRVRGSVKSYLAAAVRNTALNHLSRGRVEQKTVNRRRGHAIVRKHPP